MHGMNIKKSVLVFICLLHDGQSPREEDCTYLHVIHHRQNLTVRSRQTIKTQLQEVAATSFNVATYRYVSKTPTIQ
jgi:hypothetical protein